MIEFSPANYFDLLLKNMADCECLIKVLEIAYKKFSTGGDKHYLYIYDQDYEMT